MLLLDYFELQYLPRRLFGKSPNSSRLYRLSIGAFSKFLGRPAELSDLTNQNLRGLMQARIDGVLFSGKSRATANKDRCQILAIWRLALKDRLLDNEPEVPELVEPERVPKAWTAADLAKLFAAIERQRDKIGQIPRSLFWRALVMLCLDTGERIGAVVAAKWDWLEGQWIQFPAEVRKGGRRDRKYFLSSQTCGLLYRIRQCRADAERVFPWPYHPGYLWDLYRKILVAAGLPSRREDKFHRLRKTHASVLHQAGLDATKALDHQDRRTTERYLDPRFCTDVRPSKILAAYLAVPKSTNRKDKAG